MFKIWKKAIALCREERKLLGDIRRIQKRDLDYAALQEIVNYVANAPFGIEVEVKTNDGATITVKQTHKADNIPFESFQEKYKKAQLKN